MEPSGRRGCSTPGAAEATGLICGSSVGRRSSLVISGLQGTAALVLRHYWRGGIVAAIDHSDVYVWTGRVALADQFPRVASCSATLRDGRLPAPAPDGRAGLAARRRSTAPTWRRPANPRVRVPTGRLHSAPRRRPGHDWPVAAESGPSSAAATPPAPGTPA
ncbi:MAG: hypothetical protein U5L11_02360 [Arhodomonas sp.]|nr:hypothetical protein [Arhodomonas sp.]